MVESVYPVGVGFSRRAKMGAATRGAATVTSNSRENLESNSIQRGVLDASLCMQLEADGNRLRTHNSAPKEHE